MGNRLSAIATRTGDAGTTGLGDGSRVSKSDPRVAAMGDHGRAQQRRRHTASRLGLVDESWR